MSSLFVNDYRTFIAALVKVRKNLGIHQSEMAHALRISQSMYSKIERCERRIDSVEAQRICELLGVSHAEILDSLGLRFKPLRPGRAFTG